MEIEFLQSYDSVFFKVKFCLDCHNFVDIFMKKMEQFLLNYTLFGERRILFSPKSCGSQMNHKNRTKDRKVVICTATHNPP